MSAEAIAPGNECLHLVVVVGGEYAKPRGRPRSWRAWTRGIERLLGWDPWESDGLRLEIIVMCLQPSQVASLAQLVGGRVLPLSPTFGGRVAQAKVAGVTVPAVVRSCRPAPLNRCQTSVASSRSAEVKQPRSPASPPLEKLVTIRMLPSLPLPLFSGRVRGGSGVGGAPLTQSAFRCVTIHEPYTSKRYWPKRSIWTP